MNTLLSRVRCFWLPGLKYDIVVSFPGTRSIREDYKYKTELFVRVNSVLGYEKRNLVLHSTKD